MIRLAGQTVPLRPQIDHILIGPGGPSRHPVDLQCASEPARMSKPAGPYIASSGLPKLSSIDHLHVGRRRNRRYGHRRRRTGCRATVGVSPGMGDSPSHTGTDRPGAPSFPLPHGRRRQPAAAGTRHTLAQVIPALAPLSPSPSGVKARKTFSMELRNFFSEAALTPENLGRTDRDSRGRKSPPERTT